MHFTGITKGWASALTFSLGIALLLTAVVVAYKPAWQALGLKLERWLPDVHASPLLTVLVRRAAGRAGVAVSSIGAGALGATLILLLYPRLPAHRLVGTDIAHAVPLTLVAGIGHATLGHVDWAPAGRAAGRARCPASGSAPADQEHARQAGAHAAVPCRW